MVPEGVLEEIALDPEGRLSAFFGDVSGVNLVEGGVKSLRRVGLAENKHRDGKHKGQLRGAADQSADDRTGSGRGTWDREKDFFLI